MLTAEQVQKIEQDAKDGVPRACYANCEPQTILELVKMARCSLTLDDKTDCPSNSDESENREAEFEIRQEGMAVASTFGPREKALNDARHYAAMYGQDGPTEIVEIVKVQADSLTNEASNAKQTG